MTPGAAGGPAVPEGEAGGRWVKRPEPDAEHPLLGSPRRDLAITGVFTVATAALFVLAAVPASHQAIDRIDRWFFEQIVDARHPALTAPALVLNVLGSGWATIPLRAAATLFLAARRRWWHLASFLSAVVLAEIAVSTLKAAYARGRPPGSMVATSGASFPSGHSVAAAVSAVAVVIALFPEGRRRYVWGAAAVMFSLAMALSRAYLGAHWLSDAAAGTLLGTTLATISASVVHALQQRVAGPHGATDGGPANVLEG